MTKKELPRILDIMNGTDLSVWKDENSYFLAFPYCTVYVPEEDMKDLLNDMEILIKKMRERWAD